MNETIPNIEQIHTFWKHQLGTKPNDLFLLHYIFQNGVIMEPLDMQHQYWGQPIYKILLAGIDQSTACRRRCHLDSLGTREFA
jgi:hypothetical protein